MYLRGTLSSASHFFENIGFLRLSLLYSKKNRSQGKTIEKIARIAVFIMAGIALTDEFFQRFSRKIHLIIACPLFICSLALSARLLLLAVNKVVNCSSPVFSQKNSPSRRCQEVKRLHVKRSLINEFNATG